MNQALYQQLAEQNLKMALGDLTFQLVTARAMQQALEEEVKDLNEKLAKAAPPDGAKEENKP